MDKLKQLFNPKAWIRDVLFRKVAAKAGKYAAAAVVALLAQEKVSAALATAKPLLDDAGIDVQKAAVVLVTALIGGILNWVKNGPLKD